MRYLYLAALGFLAPTPVRPETMHYCGNELIDLPLVDHFKEYSDDLALVPGRPKIFEVDTYVHIITTTEKENDFPSSLVSHQLEVVNEIYNQIGFSFKHVNTSRTVNATWASSLPELVPGIIPKLPEYRQQLRQGTYADLNIYILSDMGVGDSSLAEKGKKLLGVGAFPEWNPSEDTKLLDGVYLLGDVLPGGAVPEYNLGLTAVHEIGHWLFLIHTFGWPCFSELECAARCEVSDPGDYILETPRSHAAITAEQKRAQKNCEWLDTCPGDGDPDPLDNFMSYGGDACRRHFTLEQIARMQRAYGHRRWKK